MKKLIALLLVLVLFVSLTACGNDETAEPSGPSASGAGPEESSPGSENPSDPVEDGSEGGSSAIGGSIYCGTYEQDNDLTNGAEPIEWIILDEDETGYFVISKYILDLKMYHAVEEYIVWETCDLRAWLNGEFYDTAFTDAEKEKIRLTTVDNSATEETAYGYIKYEHGNDTQDHIYLLSAQELDKYYPERYEDWAPEREAFATAYAYAVGAEHNELGDQINEETGECQWLLRTVENEEISLELYDCWNMAYVVLRDTDMSTLSHWKSVIGVRPVMWVEK